MTTVKAVQRGNTVRLTAQFRSWAGVAADPDSVTVRIFDSRLQQLQEALLGAANRTATGAYYYDWSTPSGDSVRYYFEFVGQLEGTPALGRSAFETVFV